MKPGSSIRSLVRGRRLAVALGVLVCILGTGTGVRADTAASTTLLDTGFRNLYNLQFNDAHRAFQDWQRQHPEDPLGPVSDAAGYLFSEFNRLNILQAEFFEDDRNFENRRQLPADPQVKAAFEAQLRKAKQLADVVLARDPKDANALFASVMVLGLRGDYVALVEKRNLAALTYMKQARSMAEQLLALYPSYYDAYLAIGVENYLLGLKPAPVRWMLHLSGAQTDKAAGLEKLRITAEKGHYLRPFARLLLAVAALREHNPEGARVLLAELAQQFPSNPLYAQELARIK